MAREITFPIGLIAYKVGPKAILTEALLYPEVSRLAATRAQSAEILQQNLIEVISKLPTNQLGRRRLTSSAELISFLVEVPAPRRSLAWQAPVTLKFRAVVWRPSENLIVAQVLELDINVLTTPQEDLRAALQRESLSTLRRYRLDKDLRSLAPFQYTQATGLTWTTVTVPVPTLKERTLQALSEAEPKISLLQTIGSRLKPDNQEPAYGLQDTVTTIREALTAKPPQSVLLVGPSGVGKSSAVRELVRQWIDPDTRFFQTSGSRIVAGQSGFGMWEQRCLDIIKDATKQRAILHLGNLIELIDVGKSECNPTGIASFLRPAIARGDLLCLVECTPEQLPIIEKEDPLLLDVFRHVTLEEPGIAEGLAILNQFAAANRRRVFVPEAIATLDRLHRRYATYSAYPGRPLRFLDRLRRDGPADTTISESEVYHAFTRETGLPPSLIDPSIALDLTTMEDWFQHRLVGQSEAVEIVVQLLATVKAGLARPNRPIASLLFIGPTGVGKTEMAKALAEFLFGSRDRLTRFDMSEYADPISVRRLVGGAFGTEGLLTAAIREQPFTVLLLDEIEKADRSAFDLLLQALGEARLTDAGGRLADFRNTVIILTSNLGAETFQRGKPGFILEGESSASAAEHFKKSVEAALRPEMFNRLDRIVPFAPLGTEVIRRIADREWQKVLQREGLRFRNVQMETDATLLDRVAETGFDARYGARPLKRAMERHLLAPLAQQLNRYPADTPVKVEIRWPERTPDVSARPLPTKGSNSGTDPINALTGLAETVQDLRRLHQLLATSSTVRNLENGLFQVQQLVKRAKRRQKMQLPLRPNEVTALTHFGQLQELLAEIVQLREKCIDLETGILLDLYGSQLQRVPDWRQQFNQAQKGWDSLVLKLYNRVEAQSEELLVAIFSEHRGHLAEMEEAYTKAAFGMELSVQFSARYFLLTGQENIEIEDSAEFEGLRNAKRNGSVGWYENVLYDLSAKRMRPFLSRVYLANVEDFAESRPGWIGSVMRIRGPGAFVHFGTEAGLHVIRRPLSNDEDNPNVLVLTSGESISTFTPSESLTRRGQIKADHPRRIYDSDRGLITDSVLGRAWTWNNRVVEALPEILTAIGRQQLTKILLD